MAQLHLILATKSSQALLIRQIRQGPDKWSCVFGWDRTADSFLPTQCVKGEIEVTGATLSPCGRWFAYRVYRPRLSGNGYFQISPYSVVSRAPWLKALAYWDTGDAGFIREKNSVLRLDVRPDENGSLLPDTVHPDFPSTGILLTPRIHPQGHVVVYGAFNIEKRQVEGWTPITPWKICPEEEARGFASWQEGNDVHRCQFEKPLGGAHWKLRLSRWSGRHNDDHASSGETHRGTSFNTFSLHSRSGEVRTFPDWTDADFDTVRNRIVFTLGQQLWAMALPGDKFGEPQLLLDLTGKAPWKAVAPY